MLRRMTADDASHYTWGEIVTAMRLPKVSLFTWVDLFTLLALSYAETVNDIQGKANQDKQGGNICNFTASYSYNTK